MEHNSSIPEGFSPFKTKRSTIDAESIENDDDSELWLIRIPENVSIQDIAGMKISLPKKNGKDTNKALGKLQKGNDEFELYAVSDSAEDTGISGHEMTGFKCLLPSREQDGGLVFAPKDFQHRLILDQQVKIPDSTKIAEQIRDTPLVKRPQPEGLKMRFKPYGYETGDKENSTQVSIPQETKRKREKGDSEKKKKKKKEKASA